MKRQLGGLEQHRHHHQQGGDLRHHRQAGRLGGRLHQLVDMQRAEVGVKQASSGEHAAIGHATDDEFLVCGHLSGGPF